MICPKNVIVLQTMVKRRRQRTKANNDSSKHDKPTHSSYEALDAGMLQGAQDIIPQTMISAIPVVLGLRTRIKAPCVYVAFGSHGRGA